MVVMGRFLNHNTVAANEGPGGTEEEGRREREMGVVHQFTYYTHNQGPHSQAAVPHVVAVAAITLFLVPKRLLSFPWKIKRILSL